MGSSPWHSEVLTWVDGVIGPGRRGPGVTARVRPWATVLRVPTRHGTDWLKAASPATAARPLTWQRAVGDSDHPLAGTPRRVHAAAGSADPLTGA